MAGAGPPGIGPNPPLIGINNSAAFNRMIGSTPKKGTSVSFPLSEEFPSARLSHEINKKVTNNAAPASTPTAAAAAAAAASAARR